MRNGARPNWAHEIVRNAAVAPNQKQQYKKYLRPLHADQPLSESDDDEPKKIRSYIKPNRCSLAREQSWANSSAPSQNLSTGYNDIFSAATGFLALILCIGLLKRIEFINDTNLKINFWHKNINSFGVGRQKRMFTEYIKNRPPPFRIPKKITTLKNVSPVSRVSVETPSSELRAQKQPSNKTPRIIHSSSSASAFNVNHIEKQLVSSTFRKNDEDIGQRSNLSSSCRDARNAVKRHDIPKPPPLPQKRAHVPTPSKNMCCDSWETKTQPPPPKKVREELETSLSTQENPSNSSKLTSTSNAACDTVRNSASNTVQVETLPWNEHANLAYLYTRKAKIFTLDTLSAEEGWYVDEFHKYSTDVKSTACTVGSESSPSSSTTNEQDGVELNNRSRRKSCLASLKDRPRKSVSFSEEVSTYLYESHAHEEDTSLTVKEGSQSQTNEILQCNLGLESTTKNSYHEVQQNEGKGDGCDQQQHFSNLPLTVVKREVVEDDDIQVLFAGNPQYIAELCRDLAQYSR